MAVIFLKSRIQSQTMNLYLFDRGSRVATQPMKKQQICKETWKQRTEIRQEPDERAGEGNQP
jgi:hypothetical protein